MISVAQAEKTILSRAKLFPTEIIPLQHAVGRILREDIKTDRDQPPFDKALMDGIALAHSSWAKGTREFKIERVIPAGVPLSKLQNKNNCVQIMTGAVLPKGCDCLIPVEQVRISNSIAYIKDGTGPKQYQFIRPKAADAKKGQVVLSKGIYLSPMHIGIAASVGKTKLTVSKKPTIAVISTGDELVDIGRPIKTHQTRISNAYALRSLFTQSGVAQPDIIHLLDNKKILYTKIQRILNKYDIVILSGGVSMGEFDFVPQILERLGVANLFHGVAQKPGKPFWFGISKNNKPVFALPGNPSSTLVCTYRYVIPFLNTIAGADIKRECIALKEMPSIKSDLVHFLLVNNGQIISSGGSGDFAGLARAEGFIEYDSHKQNTQWPYFSWRT